PMRTTSQVALMILVLTLGGATAAWAVDTCFLDDFESILVGKNFTFPTAGNCKAFDGYQNGNGNGCLISGIACGNSDDGRIKFNLNYSCTSTLAFGTYVFAIDRFNSDLPEAGFGYACQPDTSGSGHWTCTTFHVNRIACPNPHPLPANP